ncbi:FapA family protein [Paraglaciecola aquimarina]|uniref:FapA family protein n=1 Tax=Paraglaciecola algarum TaxID=3050085 RepID=A0ABS9D1Y3_9ALTE|nr:FapA family protein [Paraglaciecola sp. G1-23]MCF2946919.1 FapA family protein [Paraglaciecola sp. G1-23]
MLGITLEVDKTNTYLDITIEPEKLQKPIDAKTVFHLIKESNYAKFFIFDENVIELISSFKNATADNNRAPISQRVGERRDTSIKCTIVEGQLSAIVSLTCGYAGKIPSLQEIKAELAKVGVKRGISTKRLAQLSKQVQEGQSGETFEDTIAKGLPPRAGKPSKLQPLVQNALERILAPQTKGNERVDMRNLGAIICVKKGDELLRRLPPTEGRAGYTVTGDTIVPKPGEWLKFKPGDGTVISDHDENLLIADISGMPKFKQQKMWVDDTFTCKGVNVGTGNVEYDGAVLVNGDVTENMRIIASGDITINGFVESAYIQAGGDIIITEGAMGKVNDALTEYSTTLVSQGSIHIQHGQGLDIKCNGNVSIGRQLAYSRIESKGKVTVGAVDKPNGNIFACSIKCYEQFSAGTIGAVSGSSLNIDFSEGFNNLLERKDTLDDLVKQISDNNYRHMERMNIINSKYVPKEMQHRVDEANQLFQGESQLLQWLHVKAKEMQQSKETYQANLQMVANKKIYPGVTLKLNNRTWRADREYDRSKVAFQGHQWEFEPITSKM